MELGGDEKRIQALFSELSLEDQNRVPQFGHVWTRAQIRKEIGARGFGRPLAVLVSLLVTVAVGSLGVWAWYSSNQSSPPNIVVLLPPSVTFEAPDTQISDNLQPVKIESRHQKHSARRRQIDRRLATEAALLSSWQSPTQQFMTSQTDLSLDSLPALNQSVKDLESFLSKNSEIMKESNR
jgi:hypothetical protein